jgi:hypothetical protein
VLDRQLRVCAEPADQIATQPAGASARERRDDDLVDALVLDRLHHGRVRVGMRDLAVHVEPFAAQRRHARRSRRSASSYEPSESPCGEMIRKPAGLAAARSRIA